MAQAPNWARILENKIDNLEDHLKIVERKVDNKLLVE